MAWYDKWIYEVRGKWVPYAEDYSSLGEFDTREEAVKQIEQYAQWLNSSDNPEQR